MNKFFEHMRAELYVLKLMFSSSPVLGVIFLVINIIRMPLLLVNTFVWKNIIDEMTHLSMVFGSAQKLIYWLIFSGLLVLFDTLVLRSIYDTLADIINNKVSFSLDLRIMKHISNLDISFYDNPQNHELIGAAQHSKWYVVSSMSWAMSTILEIISFVASMVVFLTISPLYGLIYISTRIPGAIISYRNEKKLDQYSIYSLKDNRKKDYYHFLLTDSYSAKELRLYNLQSYFQNIYIGLWKAIRSARAKIFRRGSWLVFFSSLLTYIGIVAIIAFSVRSIMLGTMALGTLAMYISLAEVTGNTFQNLLIRIPLHYKNTLPHVCHFLKFLAYENSVKDDGHEKLEGIPEIEFRDVCFHYPNSENNVINNFKFQNRCR
jgi:ATP-binding cassette subfamily B protein